MCWNLKNKCSALNKKPNRNTNDEHLFVCQHIAKPNVICCANFFGCKNMFNYGLVKFLQAKKLKSNEAINAYLSHRGIEEFSAKNHNRVNDFIEKNWSNFAQFIDKSIKDGTIKGERVRLNYHFEQQKNRHLEVRKEFENENLSKDEEFLLNQTTLFSKIFSFINKKRFNTPAKNYEYTSKKLQNMPIIILLREKNLVEECIAFVKLESVAQHSI